MGDPSPHVDHIIYTEFYSWANLTLNLELLSLFQVNLVVSFVPFDISPYTYAFSYTDFTALAFDPTIDTIYITNSMWYNIELMDVKLTSNY